MTNYEQQISNTENFYDEAMKAIEKQTNEIFSAFVTEDNLHNIINIPVTEGIDEG